VRLGSGRRAVVLAPVPAAALLAAAAVAALLLDVVVALAVLTAALLALCLQAPRARVRPYLFGTGTAALGVFVVWPFLQTTGIHVIWEGPVVPVLGLLDVTREELVLAAVYSLRLAAVGLAFSAYALLLDHDRLVAAASFARRSALAVALATRLVPTLERDAAGLAEAVRGRGLAVDGVRGHARLLSPLVAGSLERAANLAEAMEARGFGSGKPTKAPSPPWRVADQAALVAGVLLILVAALWL
jgi:energy-coupling factor transport system permease protein